MSLLSDSSLKTLNSSETAEFEVTTHAIAAVMDAEKEEIGAQSDLLGLLLKEQKSLSAVEMFSYLYDEPCQLLPSQARYYKSLLPANPPGPGQQYAFEVDLDRCSGCKACVAACHTLNGLDETETWRDVGILHQPGAVEPFLQHITSACHHCVDPACMKGCPTNAYEKDPITGIVRHLDDQCFGCQYCTLACPYGVPKYHAEKGIVRKCDMCSQRMAHNEAPACVQACPHEAISIAVVDVEDVLADASSNRFLPQTHDASYTKPTTRYKTTRRLTTNLEAGDHHDFYPEHAHVPLIVMLVLIQVSLGGYLAAAICGFTGLVSLENSAVVGMLAIAFLLGQAALGAATLHLGRPFYAFRGVLGVMHSWLSREAVAFCGFSAFSGAASGLAVFSVVRPMIVSYLPMVDTVVSSSMIQTGLWASLMGTILLGALGTFSSVMVYVFTQRAFWNFPMTIARFFGTTILGGLALLLPTVAVLMLSRSDAVFASRLLAVLLIVASSWKLFAEMSWFRYLSDRSLTVCKKSAVLMVGELRAVLMIRVACGIVGGVFVPGVFAAIAEVASPVVLVGLGVIGLIGVVVGELAERALFFQAVIAPKMPGGFR